VVRSDGLLIVRQLGFLKLTPRPEEPKPDEHRVVALFKNRAELKKAYGELQEEIYRLKDRVKQQEGATQRVQEMLAALESRLALPETAYPALVFYQLRGLWQSGRELIEQFVADLSRQQEERERRLHLAECNRRQFARRQGTEGVLRAAETELAAACERVVEAEKARTRLPRLWHYFARKRAERALAAARLAVTAAEAGLGQARSAVQALEAEPSPDYAGLSIEARRAINLAAIAYAEVMCLRLAKTDLVKRAKEATSRREVSDDYGGKPECEAFMTQIARARTVLSDRTNIAQEIRGRTERLKQNARYRAPTDTVPTPESLAFSEGDALLADAGPAAAARMPNILAEDTWELFRALLR
jgi:hypothetical protein